MQKNAIHFICLLFFTALFFIRVSVIFGQEATPSATLTPTPTISGPTPTPTPDLQKLQNEIKEYEKKVAELGSQKRTLSSQIQIMNSQIKLTELRINETKKKIADLQKDIEITRDKISGLEKNISNSTKALIGRIAAVYQVGKIDPWQMFLTSDNISNFLTRLKYLRIVQIYDKRNLYAAEQAKINYASQKELFEEKQKEEEVLSKKLEGYTNQLAQEKKAKQDILGVTSNDEKKYQELLAKARAEYEAIQGIVTGKGNEVQAGEVKEGDKIASVISGASACSSGSHLHFEVARGGAQLNPADYLSAKDVEWDLCGWFGCDSPFSFNGSWQWPINGKPRITQGYGMTAYASRARAYGGGPHTGLDMISDDLTVKAVKEGILFQGSIACGGGRLKYVKVTHKDTNLDTYYLHVNYF